MSKKNEGFLSPLSISRRFPLSELLLRQAILPEGGVGGGGGWARLEFTEPLF